MQAIKIHIRCQLLQGCQILPSSWSSWLRRPPPTPRQPGKEQWWFLLPKAKRKLFLKYILTHVIDGQSYSLTPPFMLEWKQQIYYVLHYLAHHLYVKISFNGTKVTNEYALTLNIIQNRIEKKSFHSITAPPSLRQPQLHESDHSYVHPMYQRL